MNTTTDSSPRTGVLAGLFNEPAVAARALAELRAAGFSRVEISQTEAAAGTAATADDTPAAPTPAEARFFQEHESHASSFVDELAALGFSKHDAHDLVEGVIDGGAVVTADAKDDVARAADVLTRNYADVRYAQGTTPATTGTTGVAAATGAADAATGAAASTARPAETLTDERTLKLREERLSVDKRKVQHGEARVYKEVVERMETIEVPVKHEELVIERVAVSDADAADTGPIGTAGETIRIPLSEERVDVSKRTVVTGEVVVGKREVAETEHVSETLRSEELRIDESGAGATTTDPASKR